MSSKVIKTVVIDAGHGGRDPGAIGKAIKEKDITLPIAMKTGKMIQKEFPDVRVYYTRMEDKFVELYQRADIANRNNADLFISIHVNSSVRKEVNGVEFYVLGLHKADDNLEVAKKENAVVNLEKDYVKNYGFDPNSAEGNIMMTMQQSLHMDKSIQFAKTIEKKFHLDESQIVRGTKQAGFVVLYKTTMPSVLVEVGYISNSDEEQFLSNDYGQTKIAQKITDAFGDFKMKSESGKGVDFVAEYKDKVQLKTESTSNTSSTIPVPKSIETPLPKAKIVDTVKKELIKAEGTIKVEENASSIVPKLDSSSALDTSKNQTSFTKAISFTNNSVKEDSSKDIALKIKIDSIKAKSIPKAEDVAKKPVNTSIYTTPVKSKKIEEKKVKNKIVLDEEVEKSSPAETINPSSSSDHDTKSKTTPKKITPNPKKEVSEIKDEAKKVEKKIEKKVEKKSTVPSYVSNESIKDEIIENTKSIEGKYSDEEEIVKPKPAKTPAVLTKPESITISDKLVFKVQVLASKQKAGSDHDIFKLGDKIENSFENGMYKYLIGNFTSIQDASLKLNELKDRGIQDAFIVKYAKGVRVKD